ncbi:MAG: hypothetical protein AAF789_14815, partial [Bacteroidota bacterium]
ILLNQLFFYAMVPKLLDKNPVAQTGHLFKPNHTVLAYKHLNPAFVYELNQEIPIYYSSKELENVDTNTLILTRPEHLPELSSISYQTLSKVPDLLDGTETIILRKAN